MNNFTNLIKKIGYAIKLDNEALYNLVKKITKEFIQSAKSDIAEMQLDSSKEMTKESFKNIFENLYKNIWSGTFPVKNLLNDQIETNVLINIVGESSGSWQYTSGGLSKSNNNVIVKINIGKVFDDLWNNEFKIILFANQIQKTLSHELTHVIQWPMSDKEITQYNQLKFNDSKEFAKQYYNTRVEVEADLGALLNFLENNLTNGKLTINALRAIEENKSFEEFIYDSISEHPMMILDQHNMYYKKNIRKIWKLIFQFLEKNSLALIDQLKSKIDPELLDSESRIKWKNEEKKINAGKQTDFVSMLRNILSK